jgi:hypothetical protein
MPKSSLSSMSVDELLKLRDDCWADLPFSVEVRSKAGRSHPNIAADQVRLGLVEERGLAPIIRESRRMAM